MDAESIVDCLCDIPPPNDADSRKDAIDNRSFVAAANAKGEKRCDPFTERDSFGFDTFGTTPGGA
jgi:hypothetical protein